MELDVKLANKALKAWRDTLRDTPLSYPEFGRPEWAFAEAWPMNAYRHRRHTCYVYLFRYRQGGSGGFVLNADWNRAQLVTGDIDDTLALAAALSIVTMRPAAHDRKEV
jgi:hypothetical protein